MATAPAPVVVTGASSSSSTPAVGNLFAGLKFFLLRRIPQRSRWKDGIEANGGRVVDKEATADYVIADHLRSDAPGGSYSWTFIETALKDGQLPDPGDHATGVPPNLVREVSSARPPKGTRTAFTREDDLLLWSWVQREKAEGNPEKGNEIYKRLEAAHPRHTLQSWRDRYVKKLMGRPPAGAQTAVSANPPPSPPTDAVPERPAGVAKTQEQREAGEEKPAEQRQIPQEPNATDFSSGDFDLLMQQADDIEAVDTEEMEQAWAAWTDANNHHTAGAWCWYWTTVVRPAYLTRNHQARPLETIANRSNQKKQFTMDEFEEQIAGPIKRKRETSSSDLPMPQNSRKRKAMFTDDGAESASSSTPNPSLQPEAVTYLEIPGDPNAVQNESALDEGENQREPHQLSSEGVFTSDLNRHADQQILEEANRDSSESLASQLPIEENLATSDVNRDAGMQVQLDAMDVDEDTDAPFDRPATSDANRAADEQLQHESVPLGKTARLWSSLGMARIATAPSRVDKLPPVQFMSEAEENARGIALSSPSAHLRSSATRSPAILDSRRATLTSNARQRSPFRSSSSENAQWMPAEDEVVIRGLQLGWSSPQIASLLRSDVERSASAVRLRKAHLRASHADEFPPSQDVPQLDADDIRVSDHNFHNANTQDPSIMEIETGNLLTEANLASQQAQHDPQSRRGADLPEDDKSEDQMEMANYLQRLLGVSKSSNDLQDLSSEDDDEVEELDDLPLIPRTQGDIAEEQEGVVYPRLSQNTAVGFVPISSQQEIDDALEDVFKWPGSPEQRKREDASREEPAIQISYPSLPHSYLQARQETDAPSSSLAQRWRDRSFDRLFGDSEDDDIGLDAAPRATANQDEEEAMDVARDAIDGEHEMDAEQDAQDERASSAIGDDIDLMIASPPGGFQSLGFTSSPQQQSPRQSYFDPQVKQEQEEEQPAFPSLSRSRPIEIVELSSDASSSSYHSSEPKEPVLQRRESQDYEATNVPTQTAFGSRADEIQDSESEVSSQSYPGRPAIETQDILNAETQLPEFEMPLPPESDLDQEWGTQESSPARSHSRSRLSAHTGEEEEEEEEDEDSYIATMKLRGHDELSVIRALERTSGHHELATWVLLEEKLGHGLPEGIPEIWSEREDELLMSTDAAVLRELDEVHGEEECELRRRFLEAQ